MAAAVDEWSWLAGGNHGRPEIDAAHRPPTDTGTVTVASVGRPGMANEADFRDWLSAQASLYVQGVRANTAVS